MYTFASMKKYLLVIPLVIGCNSVQPIQETVYINNVEDNTEFAAKYQYTILDKRYREFYYYSSIPLTNGDSIEIESNTIPYRIYDTTFVSSK